MRLVDGVLLLLLTALFAAQLYFMNRKQKDGCGACPYAKNCAKRKAKRPK